jgi:Carbohydrate family 9 binding domain-like
VRRPRGGSAALGLFALLFGGCSKGPGLTSAQRAELATYVSDASPTGLTALDIDMESKARLLGYKLTPQQAQYPAGTRVTVTLVWQCEQALGPHWLLFTHLLGPGGETIENLDRSGPLRHLEGVEGQPLAPSRWEPGKVYRDELTFTIPASPPPSLTLVAGIHDGKARLRGRGRHASRDDRARIVRLETGEKDLRLLLKEVTVAKLSEAPNLVLPTIDGRLDDAAWQNAARVGPFVDVGSGRENPGLPVQGSARLLWDDRFLYVGMQVRDAKVRGGFSKDMHDPHLWERDTVELMIDPDGDGDNKDYYEIQVNPQNLAFDTQYDDYNSPNGNGKGPFGHEEWSAGLTSAVVVHGTLDDDSDVDQGYTVEMKIPWASFTKAKAAPPVPGTSWRMNFYAMQNNGGVAWSPILGMGNFHRASRFGVVRWVMPGSAPVASSEASAEPAPSARAGSTP